LANKEIWQNDTKNGSIFLLPYFHGALDGGIVIDEAFD